MSKKIIRLTESDLHKIVSNTVNKVISEAIPSKMMSDYFSNHGGVDAETWSADGLGDVTDDQIAFMREFNSHREAMDFIYSIKNDPKFRPYFTKLYKARDGKAIVVFFDRKKVKTGIHWGGESFKKKSDRIWRDDHDINAARQKNDIYYYGGGQRRVPANDFGLYRNGDYKAQLDDINKAREKYMERPNGEEEYNKWRNDSLKDMKRYLNNNWRWYRRDFFNDKPREW